MLFMFLEFELLGPKDMRVGNLETVDNDPDPADEIGNKVLLLDTVTVPERIPVEQDIPCDGIAVNGTKEMDAQTMEGAEETRVITVHRSVAVRTGSDEKRSEIIREVPSEADLASGVGTGEGVSGAASYVGDHIKTEVSIKLDLQHPPFALEKYIEDRFIVELVFPPLRVGCGDPPVDYFLAVLRIGMTPDNAHIQFKGIHLSVVLTVESDRQVCDPGVGAIIRDEVTPFLIFRCVYILPQ